MGLDPTPQQINNELIQIKGETYNLWQDKQNTTDTATKPDKFLISKKWKIFKDSFHTYSQSLKGMSNIPLSYAIRANATAPEVTIYSNETKQAVAMAPVLHMLQIMNSDLESC